MPDDEEEDGGGDKVAETDGEAEGQRDAGEKREDDEAATGERGGKDEHLAAEPGALIGWERRHREFARI